MSWRGSYIAVDWGTTNRRAYLLDSGRRMTESFEDDLGLMSVPAGGFEAAAQEIRDRLGDLPMLLAGMVGSNRGWREAPYAPAPAGAEELARAVLWIEPGRTGIVPGVCQSGAAGADVMRGEEVQVIGAAASGLIPADCLICHPGTHAKWIVLRGGRIHSFRTMMTGELFSLLRAHSILAPQLEGDVAPDETFRAGLADAHAGKEILSSLFAIRARHVLGEETGSPASYASGLLIGTDVRSGLALHGEGPIALVGRPDLCELYAAAIAATGRETSELDGATAFLAGMNILTEMI